MPLKPIVPDRTEEWIPPSQKDDESPTIFIIRPLTHREYRHIDNITRAADLTTGRQDFRTGDVIWWRVKFGLAGVHNYNVEFKTGKIPETSRPCVTDAFIETLPRLELLQLSGAIADLAEPDEGES